MTRHLLLSLALLAPSQLKAQDSLPAGFCDTAFTTLAMRRCGGAALRAAEQELQRYLQESRRLAVHRALLDSAQTAWERYRDIACRAAGSEHEGGTMMPLVVLSCRLALTRSRLHDLWDDYLRTSDSSLPEPKP